MASAGARIGVVGATGALGTEVVSALAASRIRVRELVLIASDRSLGEEVEFQGERHPIEVEPPSFRGLDLVFLCAPGGASLDYARQALRVEVSCVDCSGALAGSAEVPLRVAWLGENVWNAAQPLVAAPVGAALPWSLVLAPLHERFGVRRVVGTVLDAASARGRDAIESLSSESIALFNQDEPSAPQASAYPQAFDCLPAPGALQDGGASEAEVQLGAAIARLLDARVSVAATIVQVPAFVGQAFTLAIETEQAADPKQAADALAGAAGVAVWPDPDGPTLRAAAGSESVIVGRVRSDASTPHGLLLWAATDLPRLAAANAIALAAARLHTD